MRALFSGVHLVAVCLLLAANPSRASVLADSVADFSDTQGANGWYYGGYYQAGDPDLTYNATVDLTHAAFFASATWMWSDVSPHYYPWISATNQCPASLEYPGYDVWAVRRWVSDFEGVVHITATMHRDYGATYGLGYGSNNLILVNYSQISSNYLSPWDYDTYVVEFDVPVQVGMPVDFITTNAGYNNFANNPFFTAVITIPEASAHLFLTIGCAFLCSRWRRSASRV